MITVRDDAFYVEGALTIATATKVLDEGRALFGKQGGVVDFSAVTDVDSAAVSVLMQWRREAGQQGSRLICRNIPENMRNLATLYGVDEMLASL